MCYAGGLCWYNDWAINGSFAYGNVSSNGYAEVYIVASWLVAMEGSNSNVISSFRYKGQVITKFGSSSTSYIGGMVGHSTGSIINSYSNVNVTSTSTNLKCYAGGLVGYNDGSINGSFAYGNVSSKGYAEVYSFASGLVAMEGSNSNVISSVTYKGQVITKFGSSSTFYNDIGIVASLNEIISYCKTNWAGNVWSFKKTLPSF